MKILKFNNEEFKAENIIKTQTDIIGQDTNGVELFSFKGISDISLFKIEDEDGIISEFDNLEVAKQIKIQQLSDKCNEITTKEFYSDADGTNRNYGLDLENQIRIKSIADDIELSQLKGQTVHNIPYYAQGESPCREYTPEQFLKLASDAKSWVFKNVNKYKDKLKPMIEACKTVDEVNAITWDSVSI